MEGESQPNRTARIYFIVGLVLMASGLITRRSTWVIGVPFFILGLTGMPGRKKKESTAAEAAPPDEEDES
jgi:hypothetical protein